MKGRNPQSRFGCLLAAVAALAIATVATGQTFYRVTNLTTTLGTDLGFVPGEHDIFGINNSGEAAFTAKIAVEGQPQTKSTPLSGCPSPTTVSPPACMTCTL